MSVERQIKIVHGCLILLGLALGYYVSEYWLLLVAVIGAGQIGMGLTDVCGTRWTLNKLPWNRRRGDGAACARK
jgi:hypothetical protein